MNDIQWALQEFFTGQSQDPGTGAMYENGWGFRDRSQGSRLLPAFADRAPAPAPFPFIVYTASVPSLRSTIMSGFSVFDRRPQMFNFRGLVNDCVRQWEAYCHPEAGLMLEIPGRGSLWLTRGNTAVQYMGDGGDPAVTRAVVNINIRGLYF